MAKPNTPANVAEKLGISERNVQLLIKKLFDPADVQKIGKTAILTEAQVKQIANRKTTPGPEKKGKK
jgi:hypothetical protein